MADRLIQMRDAHAARPLIGVSGKFLSGKDTVAEALLERLGLSGARVSTGDLIKAEAQEMYVQCSSGHIRPAYGFLDPTGKVLVPDRVVACPVSDGVAFPIVDAMPVACHCGSTVADPVNAFERSSEVRNMLQMHGTEVRRVGDELYWPKRVLEQVRKLHADDPKLVIMFTDVRVLSEAQMVGSYGGLLIRLNVSRDVQSQRYVARDGSLPDPSAWTHETEVMLDHYDRFDVVAQNDGTLDEVMDVLLPVVRAFLVDAGVLDAGDVTAA